MNWDPMYAAAGYSTSYDAYFRARMATGLMTAWLGELGYAGRPQWPGRDYEVILPTHCHSGRQWARPLETAV